MPAIAVPSAAPEPPDDGSILAPEAGDEGARRRAERPAQVGRYAFSFLGGVVVAASTGLLLTHGTPLALGLLALGAVLLALAYVEHRWLLRDRSHRPIEAHLWPEGVELVLANGEIRVASWNDTAFAMDVFVHPARRDRPAEVIVAWKMDRRVPLFRTTEAALDRLRGAAETHGLLCAEYRPSTSPRAMRGFEIRARRVVPAPERAPVDGERTGA